MVTAHATTFRRIVIGASLALIFTTGAFAQDYIFTNFKFAHSDYTLPDGPCLTQTSVQPVVYDTSIWMVYTCIDGRVMARRFFHPIDTQPTSTPKPAAPTTAPPLSECVTIKPGDNWMCVNGGWVETRF